MSALAGLVDGFARGYGLSRQWARDDEDRQAREEERAYMREQRERLRRDQANEDALDAALKGVRSSVPTYGASAEDSDMYGPLAGNLQQTPRPQRDVLADQARAAAGVGGRRGAELGLRFQQGVDALDETQRQRRRQDVQDAQAAIDREHQRQLGDIQLRQAKALDSWRQAGVRYSRGDLVGSLQTLSAGYEAVPDGRKLVVTNGMFGLATPDGKWAEPPVPISRENVEAALTHAQRFLDPSAWAHFQTVRQGDTKIADERDYRTGMLGVSRDKLALDRDEFNAKERGGMFHRPPTAAEIFSPIGASDDGTRILGRQGSRLVEQRVPAGYENGLFPKVTGEKGPRPTKFLKGEDGTHTAYGDDGRPLYNIVNGGLEAPLGVDNSSWAKMQRDAQKAGVRAAIGKNANGAPAVAYIGRDGKPYDTLQEAAAARPTK